MSLSQVPRLNATVAICCYFPVRRGRLFFVYTFDSKNFTVLFWIFVKEMRPSPKVGPAMAGPTGPVPPGLAKVRETPPEWQSGPTRRQRKTPRNRQYTCNIGQYEPVGFVSSLSRYPINWTSLSALLPLIRPVRYLILGHLFVSNCIRRAWYICLVHSKFRYSLKGLLSLHTRHNVKDINLIEELLSVVTYWLTDITWYSHISSLLEHVSLRMFKYQPHSHAYDRRPSDTLKSKCL